MPRRYLRGFSFAVEIEPEEILTAADGVRFAVSNEWGDNFASFQKHVTEQLGWTLEELEYFLCGGCGDAGGFLEGLPEFVLGGVVLKAGCGVGGFEGGAVHTERGAQLVERRVFVAQFHIDEAHEHHRVFWQIFHNFQLSIGVGWQSWDSVSVCKHDICFHKSSENLCKPEAESQIYLCAMLRRSQIYLKSARLLIFRSKSSA